MSRETPEVAALKRALGQQLAAARRKAGVGQEQLGRKTQSSQSTVSHAEAGRQFPVRKFWDIADELVGAEGALLSAYDDVVATKEDHEKRRRDEELARAYNEIQVQQTELVLGSVPTEQKDLTTASVELLDQMRAELARFFHEWTDKVNRRKLLRSPIELAAAGLVSPTVDIIDPDEQSRVVQAIATPSRVDAKVIGHLDAIHRHLQQQHDVLGARAVLDTSLAQKRVVNSLLAGCTDNLRPQLLSVSSRMSSSIGWYFRDLGDRTSENRYFERALLEANDANDVELAVYALCLRSYTAFLQNDPHACIDLAAAAASLSAQITDPNIRALSGEVAAGACAIDGQYLKFMTEIENAREHLSTTSEVVDSPAYYYHEGYLTRRKASYLLRFERTREALESAKAALDLYDRSQAGTRSSRGVDGLAYTTLILGEAYIQAGQVNDAAQTVATAATLAAHNRTVGLVKEIRTVRALLRPWNDTKAVRELDEHLVSLGLV